MDADTRGKTVNTTYALMSEDRVIEITTNQGDLESVALMVMNAKTGEAFRMGRLFERIVAQEVRGR